MTPHPLSPARPARIRRAVSRLGAVTVALGAAVLLLAMLAGIPYGLARWVGWPLPHHWPTATEVKATLTGPFTDRLLLDTLACLCWMVWAAFVLDVLRAVPDAVRQGRSRPNGPGPLTTRSSVGPRSGPLRGLATVLLAATISGLLSLRPHAAVRATPDSGPSDPPHDNPVIVSMPSRGAQVEFSDTPTFAHIDAVAELGKQTVVVRPPQDGIYDSLWRIAQRCLGDGARWPEIYRLNRGLPQPDGGSLQQPSLIEPGWVLRLPTDSTAPPASRAPETPPGSPTSPTPTPSPPRPAPPRTPSTRQPRPGPASRSPGSAPAHPGPSTRYEVPDSPSHSPVTATGRGGGVDVGDEVFVSFGLVAAISGAVVVVRRRRRRFYRPGSGDRADLLPVAPIVRTLRLAHLRSTSTCPPGLADSDRGADSAASTNADKESDGDDSHTDAHQFAAAPLVRGDTNEAPHVSVPAGVSAERTMAVELVGMRGLGLVGPGAHEVARALLLHLLTVDYSPAASPGCSASAGPRVLVCAEAAAVLGLPDASRSPARLRVVADFATGLDELETEILRCARLAATDTANQHGPISGSGVVLLASAPGEVRRLQAILDTGPTSGVGAILLGQWRAGASLYVDRDGTVTATSPGPAEPLHGARLFQLSAPATADLLGLLHTAQPRAGRPRGEDDDQLVEQPQHHTEHTTQPSRADDRTKGRDPRATDTATTRTCTRTATTRLAGRATASGAEPTYPVPLELTVLGPVRLTWTPTATPTRTPTPDADAPQRADLTGALSGRLRELLVVLALHPDGIARDRLADTLWPDSPPERPFAALHTTLSRLRGTLARASDGQLRDLVLTGGERYRLDPHLIEVDYRAFADALAARRAAATDEQRAAAYRRVVLAYRGELAEGLTADWLETPREALRRDAVDAATSLARLLVATDARSALDQLETARSFDPYNEAIYRDIMKVQRRLAQPDAIERTLALLTTRLGELGETPEPDTVALAERLRHPTLNPGPTQVQTPR